MSVELTPEVREAICKAVEVGATRGTAAQYAEIDLATLESWVERGREGGKGDAPYAALVAALDAAEARSRVRHIQVVDLAAIDGDWKAAAWLLERDASDEVVRDRGEVLRLLSAQARAGSVPAAKLLLAEMARREGDDVTDRLDDLAARRSARIEKAG